jgi:hypothetical protein
MVQNSKTVRELRKVSARLRADYTRQKQLVRQAKSEGLTYREIQQATGDTPEDQLGLYTLKRWVDEQ